MNKSNRSRSSANIKPSVKYIGGRRFVLLRTLKYDVRQGRLGATVFPAGSHDVYCSFGTGPEYVVPETGETIRLNVYERNGVRAHA